MTVEQVTKVAAIGARLIVSPNIDPKVVRATKAAGMLSMPGVYTPTEAFQALSAGADALKLFPTDGASPKMLKALLAVLPKDVPVLAVGGVDVGTVRTWWVAGAKGFGVGSSLWKPIMTTEQVSLKAQAFVAAVVAARRPPELQVPASSSGSRSYAAWGVAAAAAVAFVVFCKK